MGFPWEHYIYALTMVYSITAAERTCYLQDWSKDFSKAGETNCKSPDGLGLYYIVGFERDDTDNLQGIKKAKCCERDETFRALPTMCQMPNWLDKMSGYETIFEFVSSCIEEYNHKQRA